MLHYSNIAFSVQEEDRQGKEECAIPVGILDCDVSSNVGQLRALRLLETWLVKARRAKGKYSTALADIAIYGPWIRFIYNRLYLFTTCFYYLCLCFTLWHPGKKACDKVWTFYLHTIIGGSYLHLYNQTSERCVSFAKLAAKLVHLGDLAAAYAEVRDEYQHFYQELGDTSVGLHVWQFFEYLLPLVSALHPSK